MISTVSERTSSQILQLQTNTYPVLCESCPHGKGELHAHSDGQGGEDFAIALEDDVGTPEAAVTT